MGCFETSRPIGCFLFQLIETVGEGEFLAFVFPHLLVTAQRVLMYSLREAFKASDSAQYGAQGVEKGSDAVVPLVAMPPGVCHARLSII
jgi:hypothetical protein